MKKTGKYLLSGAGISVLALGLIGFYNGEEKGVTEKSTVTQEVKATNQELKLETSGSFPEYTYEELNQKAEFIVEGKPTSVLDSYMVEGDVPFTKYSFKVNKIHKGDLDSKEIELIQDGNREMTFEEHPLLEIGKKYVLYLMRSESGNLVMVGGPSGKFEYKESLKAFEDGVGNKLDENLKPK